MPVDAHRIFAPFRLDSANEQLWRDNAEISLRRKTFEVLRYLVDHAGQSVTPVIHERTDDNPLFMVNVVDYLVEQGIAVRCGQDRSSAQYPADDRT